MILLLALPPAPITIHLAGDSTMAEKKPERRPETGWGEALQQYFDPAQVRIENHAKNGRSTRTFIEEGLWQQLLDRVNDGDFVFIEFGHNDEVPAKVDRYTAPAEYRRNLIRFIQDVRARKATPVLLTPVSRRKFDKQGKVVDSHRDYSAIMREVASIQDVSLIDMDRKSAAVLARYGVDRSKQLFLQLPPGEHPNYPNGIEDNTHFSPVGAEAMAALAVEAIRDLNLPLAKYLRSATQQAAAKQRTEAAEPTEQENMRPATTDGLLSAARIAALAEPERSAWQRYIALSDSVRRTDRQAIAAELRTAGADKLTPAPTGSGFFLRRSMTPEWFRSSDAKTLADIIASYQAPNGGWSKRMDFNHPRQRGEGFTSEDNTIWFSTIDNGGTTEELRFIGARLNAHDEARLRNQFNQGVEYLLTAQFPSGCWPQVFPLAGSYHDAITFNDDATVNVLALLRDVAGGKYPFVDSLLPARTQSAVNSGVRCIVRTQVMLDGRKTVWGAQHDPLTFEPVKARAYEHAALSGRESATVLQFLMDIPEPDDEVIAAVHDGAAWFRQHAIRGYTYAFRGDLTPKAGAGPLWARFYELSSGRPIFSDRDGVIRYNLAEIGAERRYGYMWYTDEPTSMLRRYERWAARHPEKVTK